MARTETTPLIRRLCAALLLSACGLAQAAPKSEPWPRWQTHDEASSASVAHEAWDQLLGRYLKPGTDGINRFAYGQLTAADRAALAAYLARLQATPVSRLARREQRPYWINLYNAETIRQIIEHYPVKSIRDIRLGGGLFSFVGGGPWEAKLLKVEGEKLSLNDIEHRILRPIWRDPRTHYAVNCASLGCPNLASRAYTAANLETQLNEGARAYINHPRGASVAGGKLRVSSIYVWFKDDFGGDDAGVIAHLRRYAAPPLAAALAGVDSIASDGYDWSLNEAR